MDKTIANAVETVKEIISGYSFADQSYMCNEIADKLRDESHECLLIEYNLTNND
ncbi:MAG: hypothetical protein LBB85_11765 [Dysgonamonadaceae bacterium]|jgi:hypothetical protein|nr:hypothetical protein [Dysgonamonadaceae bacterium]